MSRVNLPKVNSVSTKISSYKIKRPNNCHNSKTKYNHKNLTPYSEMTDFETMRLFEDYGQRINCADYEIDNHFLILWFTIATIAGFDIFYLIF